MNINDEVQEQVIQNIQNEVLFVGAIYINPNLYVEYGRFIRSHYDFADVATRFFYDNFEIMYKSFTQEMTENSVNAFMTQDVERLKLYRSYGGYRTVKKWMEIANESDFKNYMENVKKYSLLREYARKGFNVSKIMKHSKFNVMKAMDIYRLIRSSADKISTIILANDNIIIANDNNTKAINNWLISPQMGLGMPFPVLNELFNGFSLGKMLALGFLSNEGNTTVN